MQSDVLRRANDHAVLTPGPRKALRRVWELLPAEFRRDVNPEKASEVLGAGTAACASGTISFRGQATLLRHLAVLATALDRGAHGDRRRS